MCICDDKNIGNEVVRKSAEGPLGKNETAFLDLAITRPDRWSAEIHAWTTVAGRKAPLLVTEWPINFCPICGRRLALGDASRRDGG